MDSDEKLFLPLLFGLQPVSELPSLSRFCWRTQRYQKLESYSEDHLEDAFKLEGDVRALERAVTTSERLRRSARKHSRPSFTDRVRRFFGFRTGQPQDTQHAIGHDPERIAETDAKIATLVQDIHELIPSFDAPLQEYIQTTIEKTPWLRKALEMS